MNYIGIKSWLCGALLLCATGTLQAALVTYDYVITGDVTLGDELFPNDFGLTGNYGSPLDTITAYGRFTADLSVSGDVSVSFGSGSGNTMTIDLNGNLLYASNDDRYAGGSKPSLTFNAMILQDFDYLKNTASFAFNSNFLFFDDFDSMVGSWRNNASLTAVPVPAAVWLFGSGLLGLVGVARRRKAIV